MKTIVSLILAIGFLPQTYAQEAESIEPIEVMILGTFHFTGGGSDEVNPDVDNYLSETRQAQISGLLDRLEEYEPDRIMLEMSPDDAIEFNQRYEAYRQGEHELSVNERQQVGMRLAHRLGHDRLYGIDFDSFLDYRPALAMAEELGQDDLLAIRNRRNENARSRSGDHTDTPLLERLIDMNQPEAGMDDDWHLLIAQMGSVEDPEGVSNMMVWWERNLAMFARTAMQAEPGDRVLIVVGAGHKQLLQWFFETSSTTELVDPLEYLE